jgi:putative FmdB family regulatory protein
MPFYEYQCKQCGHQLEAMQKVNDAPLRKCPECGKSALQRLMSAPVFRLKGSGWYETDFKSDDEGKRNLAGSDDAEPVKAADDKASADKKDGKDDKPAADKSADKAADKATESPAKKAETSGSKGSKPAKTPVAAKPSPARKPPKRAASAPIRKKSAKRAAARR